MLDEQFWVMLETGLAHTSCLFLRLMSIALGAIYRVFYLPRTATIYFMTHITSCMELFDPHCSAAWTAQSSQRRTPIAVSCTSEKQRGRDSIVAEVKSERLKSYFSATWALCSLARSSCSV